MKAAAAETALTHISRPIDWNFVNESANAFYARQTHVKPSRLICTARKHIREMLAD